MAPEVLMWIGGLAFSVLGALVTYIWNDAKNRDDQQSEEIKQLRDELTDVRINHSSTNQRIVELERLYPKMDRMYEMLVELLTEIKKKD